MWIRLTDEMISALLPGTLLDRVREQQGEEDRRKELVQAAQQESRSDDIAVDDDAPLSIAEDGVWVGAWIWHSFATCSECGESSQQILTTILNQPRCPEHRA